MVVSRATRDDKRREEVLECRQRRRLPNVMRGAQPFLVESVRSSGVKFIISDPLS